eukprot:7530817-Pyramimonas_sp.AAC.3
MAHTNPHPDPTTCRLQACHQALRACHRSTRRDPPWLFAKAYGRHKVFFRARKGRRAPSAWRPCRSASLDPHDEYAKSVGPRALGLASPHQWERTLSPTGDTPLSCSLPSFSAQSNDEANSCRRCALAESIACSTRLTNGQPWSTGGNTKLPGRAVSELFCSFGRLQRKTD